ncbi:hypothetical protein LAUMK35_02523 [Mycobacterium pseudokansasii]|nr:hypothetical protein LAUMK35_02523 [Mycobacterium pseudokansasii]VAZ95083.1 hypothetical protein LAUMK21_02523 [Mycobacterium pseudokansasii]
MLRRQPVVDRHDHRAGAHGMVTAGAVMGVEIAHHETATVEVQHHRRGTDLSGITWWPIDPDADTAGWPVDRPVFDA